MTGRRYGDEAHAEKECRFVLDGDGGEGQVSGKRGVENWCSNSLISPDADLRFSGTGSLFFQFPALWFDVMVGFWVASNLRRICTEVLETILAKPKVELVLSGDCESVLSNYCVILNREGGSSVIPMKQVWGVSSKDQLTDLLEMLGECRGAAEKAPVFVPHTPNQ